jgi:hypothetical protein
MKNTRPPLEQNWYSKDPIELSSSIENYLKDAVTKFLFGACSGLCI